MFIQVKMVIIFVTALHVAKNEKVIELLLEAGWSPNLRDHDGNTAAHLHICSDPETSDISIPSILLSFGCDTKIKNYDGETPMDYFKSKMTIGLTMHYVNLSSGVENTKNGYTTKKHIQSHKLKRSL